MTKNGKMDWTAVSIWNGSFRALWSTVLSIMIILCDMRYGFLINWFLSCKPLLPGIPHFSILFFQKRLQFEGWRALIGYNKEKKLRFWTGNRFFMFYWTLVSGSRYTQKFSESTYIPISESLFTAHVKVKFWHVSPSLQYLRCIRR